MIKDRFIQVCHKNIIFYSRRLFDLKQHKKDDNMSEIHYLYIKLALYGNKKCKIYNKQ